MKETDTNYLVKANQIFQESGLNEIMEQIFQPRTDYPYKIWIGKDSKHFKAGTYIVKSATEIDYNPNIEF